MGPRGKSCTKNISNNRKKNIGKRKNSKYKSKNRKTYSLYSNKTNDSEVNDKRKYEHNLENVYSKRRKNEEKVEEKPPILSESSSEEDEEEEDALKQLLNTFGNVNKIAAVDTSESDDDGEDGNEGLEEESDSADDFEVAHNTNSEADDENKDLNQEKDNIITEIEAEINNSDDISTEDPFVLHFAYEINESLLNSVQSIPVIQDKHQDNWEEMGNLVIEIPKCIEEKFDQTKFSITEEKIYAPGGKKPKRINLRLNTLEDLYVKKQIAPNVLHANKLQLKDEIIPLTNLQSEIFSILNEYKDLYYPHRNFDNGEEVRFVYSLHALNHVLKTRTKIVHHNTKLTKMDDVPEEFRDQGLVRPKVMIVVPFRDSAYRIITMLINLLIKEDKGNVMNKMRFLDEFTGSELEMPKKNPKPEDYELLFSGNSSDDFKIGISVTKKTLKLYSDFYSSDIIIASPLGLRYIIGAEGETERDYDFLASIEVLILDQTEVFLMQNWDHLLHLFNHLHLQPKNSHGTDFSRVRTWSLNGWAKYYRQTIIFSSHILPEINSIFNKKCMNYAGKIKILNPIQFGSIKQVYTQLPHVFHKFQSDSASNSIEDRFNMFVNNVLPQQREPLLKQTMIYVSNYFDYVRLRNYFKKEDIGFVQICEYSKEGKIARARDKFFHGDAHFLLYSERYHFFNRKRIKGIRHLLFYHPPNFPHFYYEMCNLMQEANMNKKIGSMSNMTVTVLYSKYDIQLLSAIVGTERAVKMVSSEKKVHMLLTD